MFQLDENTYKVIFCLPKRRFWEYFQLSTRYKLNNLFGRARYCVERLGLTFGQAASGFRLKVAFQLYLVQCNLVIVPISTFELVLQQLRHGRKDGYRIPDRRIPDRRIPDRRIPDRRIPDRRIPDKRIPDRRIPDRRIPDRRIQDRRIPDRRIPDRRIPDKRIPDRRIPDRRIPDRRIPLY